MTDETPEQGRPEGADPETAERNAELAKEQPEAGYPVGDTEPHGGEDTSNEHPEDVGGPTGDQTQSDG
jgi:hypothetical protein